MVSKNFVEKNLGPLGELCEIVEDSEGILVKPKTTLDHTQFQQLYQKAVVQMGGEYVLGKMEFLFPTVKPPSDSIAGRERTMQILPLDALVPPSFAIRVGTDDVSELAETVKTHGVLEPMVVRPHPVDDGKYEVVIGSRSLGQLRRLVWKPYYALSWI